VIIVSNTSPLTNLAVIGQFDLLRQLYGEIHIPEGVWKELNAGGKRWPGCDEVALAAWIERHVVQNQALVIALQRDLDRGEAETIALAVELDADLVLLDEKEGRHAAQRLDKDIIGVVGVLLEAKARDLIPTIRPHLEALRQAAGFYLSTSFYQHALTVSGEMNE
jgi:predicted nucleic acid-binding protein